MADLKHIAEELRRIAAELERQGPTYKAVVLDPEPEIYAGDLPETLGFGGSFQDLQPSMPPSDQRDTVPAPPVQMTWQKVAGAYAQRYEKARNLAWSPGAHVQALEDIAQFIDAQQGDGKAIGKIILDAFFADPYAQKLGYPPTMLAKKAGDYLKPPSEDGKPDDQERRKRAQDARTRHEVAKARAEVAQAEKGGHKPSTADLDLSIPEVLEVLGL